MSAIAGPYGLRVVKLLGDLPFSSGMHSYVLPPPGPSTGFFYGDPVALINGTPQPLTATPVAGTLSANSPIGVFMGCEYQDPIRGFVNAQYFPANGIANGATKVKLKIMDYPWLVMQVQADGPVTLAQIGLNAALANFTAGSTTTGDSQVRLAGASLSPGTAAAAVRIYDFVYNAAPSPGASSMPGDAFTDVLVVWCPTVHRFSLAGGQ